MLCDRLQNSPHPEVRARSARSLGRLRYTEAIPLLCEIAKIEQNLQVCLAVINAVEEIMMPEQPKDRATFQIGQVGNINTGNVEIQGSQIGIQPTEDS
jgi:HEAT repeats